MMRDLFTNCAIFLTTDEIADAVLDYSERLSQRGQTTTVEFPAVVNGRPARTRMAIGTGLPLASASNDDTLLPDLEGADLAVWDIRRRSAALVTQSESLWDDGSSAPC